MKYVTIPNTLSATRIVLSIAGIVGLFMGVSLYLVSFIIIVGVLLDISNGWMARLLNKESFAGKTLDSVGDFMCFGVLLGLLFFEIGLISLSLALIYIGVNFIRELRILRLKNKKIKGLPNTVVALLFVSLFIMGVDSSAVWMYLFVIATLLLGTNINIPLMHLRLPHLLKIEVNK